MLQKTWKVSIKCFLNFSWTHGYSNTDHRYLKDHKFWLKGLFRYSILMTNFSHQSNFKALKFVTCQISADRYFSIEIRSVANLRIKILEIVNIKHKPHSFYLNFKTIRLQLAIWLQFKMKIRFWSTYFCLNFVINLNFWDIVSVSTPNLLNMYFCGVEEDHFCV